MCENVVMYKCLIYNVLISSARFTKTDILRNGNIFNSVPCGSSKTQSDLIIICLTILFPFSVITEFPLSGPIPIFQSQVFYNVLSLSRMFNKQLLGYYAIKNVSLTRTMSLKRL